MKKHVTLIGFMAAGKSTIGKRLARKLGCGFIDLDAAIEGAHGPIGTIFSRDGEEAFRHFEYEAAAQAVSAQRPAVLAVGGGALTHDATFDLLRRHTELVFIDVPLAQIAERLCKSRRVRPVLGPEPSLAEIEAVYEKRIGRYASAGVRIDAGGKSPAHIADDIVRQLHERSAGSA